MTNEQRKKPSGGKGKQRRTSKEPNQKTVSVRLTASEHNFFTAASDVLGQTLSVLFRNAGQRYVEEQTELRLRDFEPDDQND
jgi:hypothetical protein